MGTHADFEKISHKDVVFYQRLRSATIFFARSLAILPPLGVVGDILSYPMPGQPKDNGFVYMENLLKVSAVANQVFDALRKQSRLSHGIVMKATDEFNFVEVLTIRDNGRICEIKHCSCYLYAKLHALLWIGNHALGKISNATTSNPPNA